MSNIYYEPQDFGLEIFEQIDDDHSSYSFDDFVIWKRLEDGKLFYATDSGCSCPSPFEDTKIADLIPVHTLEGLAQAIEEYRDPYKNVDSQRCTIDRKQEVLRKVKEYLGKDSPHRGDAGREG